MRLITKIMKNLEPIFRPERPEYEQLFLKIKILKEKFPDLGIVCNGMKPIEKKIEVFNAAEPPTMQFRPKNLEEMQKLAAGVKETASITSIHLNDPKFNEMTGEIESGRKGEIISILKQRAGSNFNLITMHSGWKYADSVLDEAGEWKKTALAEKVAGELADLLIAGIQSGKTMTLENVGHKEEAREILGTRPEHLIVMRNKIAEVAAAKTGLPSDEVLEKIGYTFDMGHAVRNAHLSEQYPTETWLKRLGQDIKLMHIHDILPPEAMPDETLPEGNKNRDRRDHKALGRGIVDWQSFFKLKKRYCPEVPMILELNDDGTGANTVKSVDYLEKLER